VYTIMIHIRKADMKDKPEELISKGALREGRHDLVMVVLEDDTVMGCCSMELNGLRGIINALYIKGEKRDVDLGDGLVRSTLYSALRRGIEWVEVPLTQQWVGLFKGLGFKPDHEKKEALQLNLEEFFNNCCCCGNEGCEKTCSTANMKNKGDGV